jgi:hypothetical protein
MYSNKSEGIKEPNISFKTAKNEACVTIEKKTTIEVE